jgi:hypothetical protein
MVHPSSTIDYALLFGCIAYFVFIIWNHNKNI